MKPTNIFTLVLAAGILFYGCKRKDDIEKTVECIHYLSRLGDLIINITPAENLVLAYEQWLTQKEFLEVFPEDISRREGYSYGDIFVKMQVSHAGVR